MSYESRFALLEAVGNCTATQLDREIAQLEVLMSSPVACTSGDIEALLDRIAALNCRMHAVRFLVSDDDEEDDPYPEEMPNYDHDEDLDGLPLPFAVRVK